jgi:BirA family transcriptional regulator, biotin operon repressor / biotin---[acetyl-CoA-carboxylase] ligase
MADAGAVALHLDTIDSTNAEALRRARAGARGPLWIVAREQTAGRGRRRRAWESLPGNLYATLLLSDPAPAAMAPQLAFVAALAVYDAVVSAAPALAARFALKWPNDLLCGARKIAGILIEGEGTPLAVAVGIGANCRHHPQHARQGPHQATAFPATDLAAEGADVQAAALFDLLAAAMPVRLAQWNRGAGFAAIRRDWLARAHGLGHPIEVRLAERAMTGQFETVDDAGRLMLRTHDGGLEAVAAGEVFPLDQTA